MRTYIHTYTRIKTGLGIDLKLPAGPPTLLHTNFKLLLQPKRDVDARIVVIGPSDAACETQF